VILADNVIISDSQNASYFGKKISILKDIDSQYSIENIKTGMFADSFFKTDTDIPNFGFSRSSYWARFNVKNESTFLEDYLLEIDYPPLDFVELYIPDEHGSYIVKKTGDHFIFSEREIPHKNYLFHLKIPVGKEIEYYIRIKTSSISIFKLSILNVRGFQEKDYMYQWWYGFYYGTMMIMIVYNLLLYIGLREKLYLYFFFYSVSLCLYMFINDGYAFQSLWPNSIYWNNKLNTLSYGFSVISGIQFIREFLGISDKRSFLKKLLNFISIVLILISALVFVMPYMHVTMFLNIVTIPITIILFIAGIISWRKQNFSAKIYLTGFSGLLISALLLTLSNLGIIEKNFLTLNGIKLGTAFISIFFSIAIAFRINLLKKQNRVIRYKSRETDLKLSTIEVEMENARKIHRSLLPSKMPQVSGIKMQAVYLPSSGVGGDFYDFIKSGDDSLGIVIADVTGHGFPAAFYASMVKYSFSKAASFNTEPDQLLYMMNNFLYKKLGNLLLTAGYMYINRRDLYLEYASCGHPPLIIWNRKEQVVKYYKPKGRMIGVLPNIDIEKMRVEIAEGDRILIYTDGLTETINSEMQEYGEKSLEEFIFKNQDLPPREFSKRLLNDLSHFSGIARGSFSDDITFVVVDIV
jgi:serine phosphatase RsbU (regulator of sigma subunit)